MQSRDSKPTSIDTDVFTELYRKNSGLYLEDVRDLFAGIVFDAHNPKIDSKLRPILKSLSEKLLQYFRHILGEKMSKHEYKNMKDVLVSQLAHLVKLKFFGDDQRTLHALVVIQADIKQNGRLLLAYLTNNEENKKQFLKRIEDSWFEEVTRNTRLEEAKPVPQVEADKFFAQLKEEISPNHDCEVVVRRLKSLLKDNSVLTPDKPARKLCVEALLGSNLIVRGTHYFHKQKWKEAFKDFHKGMSYLVEHKNNEDKLISDAWKDLVYFLTKAITNSTTFIRDSYYNNFAAAEVYLPIMLEINKVLDLIPKEYKNSDQIEQMAIFRLETISVMAKKFDNYLGKKNFPQALQLIPDIEKEYVKLPEDLQKSESWQQILNGKCFSLINLSALSKFKEESIAYLNKAMEVYEVMPIKQDPHAVKFLEDIKMRLAHFKEQDRKRETQAPQQVGKLSQSPHYAFSLKQKAEKKSSNKSSTPAPKKPKS